MYGILIISTVATFPARYRGKVQLNGPDHEAILHDKTSSKYMAYKDGVEHGVDTAYKECTGNQLIDDLDFRFVFTVEKVNVFHYY